MHKLPFALLIVASTSLWAHPPKQLEASYDKKDKSLKVTVVHKVDDLKTHFIEAIQVEVNGKELAKVGYSEQNALDNHLVSIPLGELAPGSKIKIKATCNKFGSKTLKLTVE